MSSQLATPNDKLREAARFELARRRFEHFITLIDPAYQMGWAQRLIARKLQRFFEAVQRAESPRLMIFLPPRHPLADSTPVFTPKGWTTHGQLKPGDEVFGIDGRPTKVVAVSAPTPMTHRVVVGEEAFDCGPGHLWPVLTLSSTTWQAEETEWLALQFSDGGRPRFRLPDRAVPAGHDVPSGPFPIAGVVELPPEAWTTGRCIEVERPDGLYLVGRTMVPTHNSKSLTVSQLFPMWGLGQDPTLEFVVASYGMSLPAKFSRRVRETLRSDRTYHRLFPDTSLHPEVQSVEEWETALGGGFRPVGRGGSLTGKGAHVLIVDDILKDAEEADSALIRENAYDWYSSTAYTRLYPGGGVIIVMTRWHVEDLAGILLAKAEAARKAQAADTLVDGDVDPDDVDQWDVLQLPAIAETVEWVDPDHTELYQGKDGPDGWTIARTPGDALHPERYSASLLKRIKATLIPRHWQALYQQQPLPEGGAFFEVDKLRYGTPPLLDACRVVIAADTAASTDQSADDSCIMALAMDAGRNIWVLDAVANRINVFAFVDLLIDFYEKFPMAVTVGIEAGPLREAIMPVLEQRMLERGIFLPLADKKEMRPQASKEIRARPMQGVLQTQRLWLPPDRLPWVEKLVRQMKRFPQSSEDDMVDTAAWGVRLLLARGLPATARRRPATKSWKDRLARLGRPAKTFMRA